MNKQNVVFEAWFVKDTHTQNPEHYFKTPALCFWNGIAVRLIRICQVFGNNPVE